MGNIFSDVWNKVVKPVGSIAAPFLKGVPWLGPAIAGIDALTQGNEAQNAYGRNAAAAEQAAEQQRAFLAQIAPHLLAQLGQDPYAVGGAEDPYSPTNTMLEQGQIRAQVGQNLDRTLQGLNYMLPGTGVNSSQIAALKAKAYRDAAKQSTQEEIAARIQGGRERYQNMVANNLQKRQYAMALPGVLSGAAGAGVGTNLNLAGIYGQDAQNQQDTLAKAVEALISLGKKNPQGGKDGATRGDKAAEPVPASALATMPLPTMLPPADVLAGMPYPQRQPSVYLPQTRLY